MRGTFGGGSEKSFPFSNGIISHELLLALAAIRRTWWGNGSKAYNAFAKDIFGTQNNAEQEEVGTQPYTRVWCAWKPFVETEKEIDTRNRVINDSGGIDKKWGKLQRSDFRRSRARLKPKPLNAFAMLVGRPFTFWCISSSCNDTNIKCLLA